MNSFSVVVMNDFRFILRRPYDYVHHGIPISNLAQSPLTNKYCTFHIIVFNKIVNYYSCHNEKNNQQRVYFGIFFLTRYILMIYDVQLIFIKSIRYYDIFCVLKCIF